MQKSKIHCIQMQHKPGKIKAKTNNTTEEKNTPKEGNKHTNDKNNKK